MPPAALVHNVPVLKKHQRKNGLNLNLKMQGLWCFRARTHLGLVAAYLQGLSHMLGAGQLFSILLFVTAAGLEAVHRVATGRAKASAVPRPQRIHVMHCTAVDQQHHSTGTDLVKLHLQHHLIGMLRHTTFRLMVGTSLMSQCDASVHASGTS